MKRKVTTFSIDESILAALDRAAFAANVSRSRYVENLLYNDLTESNESCSRHVQRDLMNGTCKDCEYYPECGYQCVYALKDEQMEEDNEN